MRRLAMFFIIAGLILLSADGCARHSPTPTSVSQNNAGNKNVLIDYADVFTIDGVHYSAAYDQVITDEKMIENEVGAIKFTLVDNNVDVSYQLKDGDATFLKVGTKVYSLKGFDKKDFVTAQSEGSWRLYKAVSQKTNETPPSGKGISDETYNATALIVEKSGNTQPFKIENKDKIKKLLDGIKAGVQTEDSINYPQENMYTFYFLIPDKTGIGQIVYKYYLSFQDINLDGYVRRFNDTYKVDSGVSKIIAESFGTPTTIYDSKLGGKQQVYDIYASGKFILRKVLKETPQEKFTVKLLNQGEEIWQNGNKVKDTLHGKYKVELFMKDTKLQDKILNTIISNQYNLPGVLQISYSTTDSGNSSVIYFCYDEQPDLSYDETTDSFVLINK